MNGVVTMVSARIEPEREPELIGRLSEALRAGLPGERRQTSLLRGDDNLWRLVSVWQSRADVEDYLASVEEPFADWLFRAAGGVAEVEIFDVVLDSSAPFWS
jgi:hypothetical protein